MSATNTTTTETTTVSTKLATYDPSREGHNMGPAAEGLDACLFESLGSFVSPERLAEVSGLGLGSIPWRIFQLRCRGWVIETARTVPVAFAEGARGWRLVDMVPVCEAERRAQVVQAIVFRHGRKVLGGRAVFHAEFGEGRVTFEREGFPALRAAFGHGEEKVSRADVIEA